MADHLTDEERVETLKKWWKENGTAIVVGITLGLGVIIGYWQWTGYTEKKTLAASAAYDNFSQQIISGKPEKIAASYSALTTEFTDTSYATLAALLYASYEFDKKNTDKAIGYLRWANEHSGHEVLSHVSKTRLARLLVAENKLDEAFALVEKANEPAFLAQYAEIRGDIYNQRGKTELARAEYKTALDTKELKGARREFVQMKFDNLGLASAADKTKETTPTTAAKENGDAVKNDNAGNEVKPEGK